MELWIYNDSFSPLGVVDTAPSIIWANRYRQCGDMELYVPATDEMRSLLIFDAELEDRFVVRRDDEMACFIERTEIVTDEEKGDFLLVTGRCLRSIYSRRIVWDQTNLSGTVENGLRRLVADAFMADQPPGRKYAPLRLAPAHGYADRIEKQITGGEVLAAMEEICAANNYGMKVTMDPRQGTMTADFYKGTNRTAGQRENPRVIFSEDYGNLLGTNHTRDVTAYKTVAKVAGEGEGTARRSVVVSRTGQTEGLRRREMYVDARDISSNDGEIGADEYDGLLLNRGSSAMSEAAIVESMTGSIVQRQYVYGRDYFLGDMVTVIDKFGSAADAQVLEIIETWDENGYTATPTFG